MAAFRESRDLRSSALTSNPALMDSDLEQIIRRTNHLSFNATFQDPQYAMQKPSVTLKFVLQTGAEELPFNLTPALDVPLAFK